MKNYMNKSNQISVGLRKSFQSTECKMANEFAMDTILSPMIGL